MKAALKRFKEDWKDGTPREKGFMIAGAVALLLAIIGLFIPLVPQVPFAIGAAALFAHGSPGIHRWIRKNRHLGPPVKDWEDHRVLKPQLKAFSVTAMLLTAGIGHWKFEKIGIAIGMDVVLLAAIVFVLLQKSRPQKP